MCIHVMFTICEKQHRSFSTSDFSRCRIAMTVMWTLWTFLSGERSSIGKSQALECLPPIVGKRSAFLYWLKPPWHAMVHVISTTKCEARLKIWKLYLFLVEGEVQLILQAHGNILNLVKNVKDWWDLEKGGSINKWELSTSSESSVLAKVGERNSQPIKLPSWC